MYIYIYMYIIYIYILVFFKALKDNTGSQFVTGISIWVVTSGRSTKKT